jgi:hypothetical protein
LLAGKGGFLPNLMTNAAAMKQHVTGYGPTVGEGVNFVIQASRQGEPAGLDKNLTPGQMEGILTDLVANLHNVPGCLPDLASYLAQPGTNNWSMMLLFTYVRQVIAAHNADLLRPVQCFPVPANIQGATSRARWVDYLLTCAKQAAGLIPAGMGGNIGNQLGAMAAPTGAGGGVVSTAILAVLLRATPAELADPNAVVIGQMSPKDMLQGMKLVLSSRTTAKGIFDTLQRIIALLRYHMDWFHTDKSGEEKQLMQAKDAFIQLERQGKTPELQPHSFLSVLKLVPSLKAAHTKVLECLELEKTEAKANKRLLGVLDTKASTAGAFDAEDLIDANGKANVEAMQDLVEQRVTQALKRLKGGTGVPVNTTPPAAKTQPGAKTAMSNLIAQVMLKFPKVARKDATTAAVKMTNDTCAHCKSARVNRRCTSCKGQGAPHKDFVDALAAVTDITKL